MDIVREAFYLDAATGQRYCLVRRPSGSPIGSVVFVPPFAEEMNKSRRMVALAAERLAGAGWCVVQLDLFGTGDSSGDFGDAGWQDWLDDLDLAHAWLQRNVAGPMLLWSLRAGSLIASDWLRRSGARPAGWLMWQPVLAGKQHLTQFLRLKAAGEMLADSEAGAVMAETRAALGRGESVEVAGYALSAALAQGMEAASVALPADCSGKVVLVEVQATERAEPSPAVAVWCKKQAGHVAQIETATAVGAGFWQTQEIELVPGLLDKTDEVMACMPR